jgi:cytochrome P450
MTTRVDIMRPRRPVYDTIIELGMDLYDPGFAFLRRFFPLINTPWIAVLSLDDDVRAVLRSGDKFKVIYEPKLDPIMDDRSFLLGQDGAYFDRDVAAIRKVFRDTDISRLADHAARQCAAYVAASNGNLEVIDLVSQAMVDVFTDYLGITAPPGHDLRVIALRVIEFVLADVFQDKKLRADAVRMAGLLRDHVDALIADRKAGRSGPTDDVLGRCLDCQAAGEAWFTDDRIRTLLVGLICTALPQPPIAAAQVLDQLLRRPAELAAAQALARSNDLSLTGYVFEALRFAPLVPLITRTASGDQDVAVGTRRKTKIKAGVQVLIALRSAMRDPRRLAQPEVFDPTRLGNSFLLFGDGPHACVAERLNRAMFPRLVGEIVKQDALRRAPGRRGRVLMRAFFADRLCLEFGPA